MSGQPITAPTALVALIPEAEAVVGRWRPDLDPSARRGMPPHITVLYPWMPLDELTEADEADLGTLIAAVPSFVVSLTDIQRFPETLWLAPYPADPFIRLTMAVQQRWPAYEPYSGRFGSIEPHLSIGDAIDPDALGHVVADVSPQLPIEARVTGIALMRLDDEGRWQQHAVYPLG
jgi:2'-5' RNA ligase superfamily